MLVPATLPERTKTISDFFIGQLADCQTVLVELLVAMVSQRITAEELALLIRLFLEKTPPTVNTLSVSQQCPVSSRRGCWQRGELVRSQSVHLPFLSLIFYFFFLPLLSSLSCLVKLELTRRCSPVPTPAYVQLTPK